MKNGIVMLGTNRARINLLAHIGTSEPDAASTKALQAASLSWWESKTGKSVDNVNVPTGKLELTEERYVYKEFRALSEIFLNNRGLDFSRPGVLKKAVDLIIGIPIFANHDFRDIDNARGVIADAYWDEKGEKSNGVPGINVNCKVDAFLNYRTACNLMSKPPVINRASVTVVSEVEFSHPELVKNGTFWDKFLEEVDGEIVRLIVTNIIEFWEMSFVFLGEDRLAKGMPDAEPIEDEEVQTSARKKQKMSAINLNATEKKMKITNEQKELLGITAEGEDVPEQDVLNAALETAKRSKLSATEIAELSSKAKDGETLMTEKRNEVIRLAKLAELGAEEGSLPSVLTKTIEHASAEELVELETYYRGKVQEKFPDGGKSSLENSTDIEKAGNVNDKPKRTKPVNVGGLH